MVSAESRAPPFPLAHLPGGKAEEEILLIFLMQPRSLENLLDPQHELMTCRAILCSKLLINVGIKKPASAVPNHSWTDRTHLFRRVAKRHSIDLSIGNLLDVIAVGTDP